MVPVKISSALVDSVISIMAYGANQMQRGGVFFFWSGSDMSFFAGIMSRRMCGAPLCGLCESE